MQIAGKVGNNDGNATFDGVVTSMINVMTFDGLYCCTVLTTEVQSQDQYQSHLTQYRQNSLVINGAKNEQSSCSHRPQLHSIHAFMAICFHHIIVISSKTNRTHVLVSLFLSSIIQAHLLLDLTSESVS